MIEATVNVALKSGVLDPQGTAVTGSLRSLGFHEVTDVRVGRTIVLQLEGDDEAVAAERVAAMCDELLANPVVESWRLERLRTVTADTADAPVGARG